MNTLIEEISTWTTKDGKVLNIRDMTTEHINNTLRFLDRRELAFYSMEFEKRIAESWEKNDARQVPPSHPAYVSMLKELCSRGEISYEEMNERLGWHG